MQHESQKPASPSASPTPGQSHRTTAGTPTVTRRELRLAAQRAAADAHRAAQSDVAQADVAQADVAQADVVQASSAAVPSTDAAPTPPVLTRRMLRAAQAGAATDAPAVASVATGTSAPVASLGERHLTRRELRAATTACPPPFALIDAPHATAHAPGRPRAVRVAKSATTLALSAALAVSGFALQDGVTARTTAAEQAEAARQHAERVAGAQTARLTAQAEAWAAGQRTEALQVASSALAQADAVVQTAAPLVQPEAVAPLDEAVASLEAMVIGAEPGPGATAEQAVRDQVLERTSRTSVGRGAAPAEVGDAAQADDAAQAEGAVAVPQAPVAPVSDLATTQEMFQVAEQVAALTAEVQAATEARIAEEAARAVAEAAAAEMARKVAIAQDAPNGEIPSEALCAPAFAGDELLRCDAAEALERLNEAYRAEFGRDLSVVSSYRSYSMQVSTRRSRGGLAATPGTSNHGRAVAVDFGDFGRLGNFRDPDYLWMKENGPAFGWYHPSIMEPGGGGPQEPWHWEYGTDSGWDDAGR